MTCTAAMRVVTCRVTCDASRLRPRVKLFTGKPVFAANARQINVHLTPITRHCMASLHWLVFTYCQTESATIDPISAGIEYFLVEMRYGVALSFSYSLTLADFLLSLFPP